MEQHNTQPDPTLRQLQVVAVALMVGILLLTFLAVFIVGPQRMVLLGDDVIAWILVGLAIVQFIVGMIVVPNLIRRDRPNLPQTGTSDNSNTNGENVDVAVFRARTIMRFAICEGAAFLSTIAFLITGELLALAVTAGILFIMLTMFPTQTRLTQYLESQQFVQ